MHHIYIIKEMNVSVLTIHAEDYLDEAVRKYANRFGKSINLAAKELLSSALGLVKPPCKRHDFTEFCGVLKKGEAEKMRHAVATFDTIDGSFWK